MELKKWALVLLGLTGVVSCADENGPDAYGQFEADEIVVSAETNGQLLSFTIEEGQTLEKGTKAALVDTTQIYLQKKELEASLKSVQSNINKLEAQKQVFQSQFETAQKELNRLQSLQQDNAATQQQLDSAEGQVNTLQRQIESVEVDKNSVHSEMAAIDARIDQINDQIERAVVTNPVSGTVLHTFAEQHELVSRGTPLYRLANLEEMTLRIYISGAQLPQIRIGDNVSVFIDKNEQDNERLDGRVSWIASEAEFTPRMIQTKEERVTQVYSVKIRVSNPEGKIKIGMPGEIRFNRQIETD